MKTPVGARRLISSAGPRRPIVFLGHPIVLLVVMRHLLEGVVVPDLDLDDKIDDKIDDKVDGKSGAPAPEPARGVVPGRALPS
jgi:hypothetical protein